MKLAIIGCGIITQEAHVPALLKLKDKIEIKALCNHSLPKAEKTAALLGRPELKIYTDWKEMISTENEIDTVLVSLPIPLNYPVSKACVEAGFNVFCEKPAALNSAEAELTLGLNQEGGALFRTAENFHYRASIFKAQEMIKAGIIGQIHSMQWNLLQFMQVDNKFNKTQWRANNEYPGGYVMDGGVHFVHNLQQIAGAVTKVFARTASVNSLLGTMDTGFAVLTHDSGVISSINMGWQHCHGDEALKVFGTEGSLSISDGLITLRRPDASLQEFSLDRDDTFFDEWQDFVDSLAAGTTPQLRQEDAVRDVKIIEAMIESDREGREVLL
ncbi:MULTISPECIES: Gfo/Idh/MocA family protein [unclassified Oceanispirochaeta]|uniref:Gfo/Idh/MocA family protein n=1 Tax=unclassified Oceanispirochaeta TaxID=2635722 RepID=UPI000E08D3B7|nr:MULTISPECIES: Gfo/Idh/MocA family oxidoreductase [unclassified Oceanispirochaeta]MBF9015890.1 Gfo/Idh/MocA family oxidoreductase [Oceanispirochaeta sp. M2]NPD72353.1 Gfo/Idh/MocA family oxidoreductase [Oceanispirochaeta sp. M1]RDG32124.1 gfo/Idh/MocA family oxidoreductase [Oceanispirochaeta sp. M1]